MQNEANQFKGFPKPHLLLILPFLFGESAQAFEKVYVHRPPALLQALQNVESNCPACLESPLIIFGNKQSKVNNHLFRNVFQGRTPRAYALSRAPDWGTFYRQIQGVESSDELNRIITGLLRNVKLLVFENEFQSARAIPPNSPPQVTLDDTRWKRLQAKGENCPKSECSPRVILQFTDRSNTSDEEMIRVKIYAGSGTTLWRESDDVRWQDFGPHKRRGVLYWGHVSEPITFK